MRRTFMPALIAGALLGCFNDSTVSPVDVPQFAKGGGGGKSAPSVLTMSGDIGPMVTANGEAVTATLARSPFKNLTLSSVRITIGEVLSGDGARCRELMPNRTVVPTGDDTDWDERVRGDWVGELSIWQGRTTSESNMKFAGTRPDDADVAVQFTSNSTNAVQTTDGTTTTLTFVDAPLGFGDGPGRIVPRDENGLPIIYCMNVQVIAQQ
jgi:hypothetical protein